MLKKLTKRAKTQQPKAAAATAKPAPAKKHTSRKSPKLPTGLFTKLFAAVKQLSLRHRRRQKLARLRAQDEATRAARLEQFQRAQQVWVTNVNNVTGATERQAPTQRTWEEPPTAAELTPVVIPVQARPQNFVKPTARRSYQIPIIQAD